MSNHRIIEASRPAEPVPLEPVEDSRQGEPRAVLQPCVEHHTLARGRGCMDLGSTVVQDLLRVSRSTQSQMSVGGPLALKAREELSSLRLQYHQWRGL